MQFSFSESLDSLSYIPVSSKYQQTLNCSTACRLTVWACPSKMSGMMNGRVYIYYTMEEICDGLNRGRDKAMKLLADKILPTAKEWQG